MDLFSVNDDYLSLFLLLFTPWFFFPTFLSDTRFQDHQGRYYVHTASLFIQALIPLRVVVYTCLRPLWALLSTVADSFQPLLLRSFCPPNSKVAQQTSINMEAPSTPVEVANPVNAIVLPIFALIGIIITYFPFISFWKYRNVAALSLVAIAGYLNLTTAINAFIWPNDDFSTWYPGYGICDIETELRYPVTTAFATALCCLSKNLAEALDTENAIINITRAMKRRKMWIDVAFCWGIPFMQAALHILVSMGRYSINPVFGCSDFFDNSWPTIVIILIWCPIFLALNIYYAGKLSSPIIAAN